MNSYHDLLSNVLLKGEVHADRTGTGTLSIFGAQWHHDMSDGFPLITTKKVPLRVVFEELRWFLSGSSNRNTLKLNNVNIWDDWESPNPQFKGDMGPIYGVQWREFGFKPTLNKGSMEYESVDQIQKLLHDIKHNPNSRRLLVSAWNPPYLEEMALPPCHYSFQIKCHENDKSMSLHMTMRSCDIFLGLPFNIASYALLLEMIAHVTGYKTRSLTISFGDLHLYRNHMSQVAEQLTRDPFTLPTVTINEVHVPNDATPLERLLNMTWENITLNDYLCHPTIKGNISV